MCTFIYFLSRAGRGKIIWKAVWDGKCDLLSHRLWKPEEHRCTQKVTSVDLEPNGDASLYYRLSKLWLEWKLVSTKVFSTLREPCSARRAHCFLGDVAAETEIFALHVRIRAHYSLWYVVLQIFSCTGSEWGGVLWGVGVQKLKVIVPVPLIIIMSLVWQGQLIIQDWKATRLYRSGG